MGPDAAKKRGDESKNHSPPIPPTRIPYLLIPEFSYVRFFEFSVFQFFGLLDPYWTPVSHSYLLLQAFSMEANTGPIGAKKTEKKTAKSEKPKNQETLHKRGLGFIKMGFW